MRPDEFTKPFTYMQEMRKEVREGFEGAATKAEVDQPRTTLNGTAEMDDVERITPTAQVNRHENWTKRTAPKLRLKYEGGS